MLTVQFYMLVVPTGSMRDRLGLGAGFALAAAVVVALTQSRERCCCWRSATAWRAG